MVLRRSIALAALLAPFLFPWPYVAVLGGIATLFYPPIAFAVGLELDALYFVVGAAHFPFASVWGFLGMMAGIALRRFVHTQLLLP